jgi:hypothetical protein
MLDPECDFIELHAKVDSGRHNRPQNIVAARKLFVKIVNLFGSPRD